MFAFQMSGACFSDSASKTDQDECSSKPRNRRLSIERADAR